MTWRFKTWRFKARERGQILIEVMIASLLLIFLGLAITQILNSSIRGLDQTGVRMVASFLSQETSEALRMIAKEDWHNITNLATSSANVYYPLVSAGKWVTVTGTESVSLNGITYQRSFYIDEVQRSNATGEIVSSGGYFDPSTAKATIRLQWTDLAGRADSLNKVVYFTRFLNQIYTQTDWSGGNVGETVTSIATTTFATSSGIDFSVATGSLKLKNQ